MIQTLREKGFRYLNAISDNFKREILSGTEILLKILCIYIYPCVYLYAGLPKVDAESVGVPGVVLHQLLQGSERGTPRDKESTLV